MRLVHISDLHLGFRQYHRLTQSGINQREADVANTFRSAIDRIIALEPDVVVFAGDIFHTVRPMNPAIIHAFIQLARLARALPRAIQVMIAGNHDRPRATETGCILYLFSQLGVNVVHGEPRRLLFPERDLAILAVPSMIGDDYPALMPEPGVRHNVLLLHGLVPEKLPLRVLHAEHASMSIPFDAINPARWSYVALGHYHVHQQIAPNAYYSGSLDYTSNDPWGELVEEREAKLPGKGFIEFDLVRGTHTFHALPPSRPLVDLPPVTARGMTAPELDAVIRGVVDRCPGGIDGKIVRLVVREVPRHIGRELDQKALREYKRRALSFNLDARRPDTMRSPAGRRPTLREMVESYISKRTLSPGIDRDALVQLGTFYLQEADAAASVASAGAPSTLGG